MLKSFLVAVDGSEYASAAVEYAAALARDDQSRIGLLYVINVTSLEGPYLADLSGIVVGPFLDFKKQVQDVLEEKAGQILENHAAACRKAGVEHTTAIETGTVSRVICQEALKYDVVVIGRRGEHASWRGFLLGSVVEEVVRGCSKPVLVTTREVNPPTRILAAYDGSKTAGRALGIALAAAQDLNLPVVVVSVASDETEGHNLLREATTYLEPHQLEVKTVLEKGGNAVEGILKAADRENCDLIVMGAYGQSRVRELFLGSTTDGILREAKSPVLLYR